VEKPSVDEAPSNLAVSARYVFGPEIFDAIRRPPVKNGEYQITESELSDEEEGEIVDAVAEVGEAVFDIFTDA